MGGHFPTDTESRAFGVGRSREDNRRGGPGAREREERLLPHFAGGGNMDQPKDSRFNNQNQRGVGRDDYGGGRDRPTGSFDSSSRKDGRDDRDDQRSASRDNRDSRSGRQTDRDNMDRGKRGEGSASDRTGILQAKSMVKEDSPVMKDELSLACLFSQTETILPVKKKTTKSFGGKKSPKKSAVEEAKSDKTKSGLASRLGASSAQSKRQPERKIGSIPSTKSGGGDKKADSKSKDSITSDKNK